MQNLINIICFFMLGGSLASFYNVFVTRREKKENFISERSHCDYCKEKLKFVDMIPVFSYLVLRGKCRYCKREIGLDKFITELLSAVLSVIFIIKHGISLMTITLIFISVVLISIGLIDFKTGYIHNIDLIILLILSILYLILSNNNLLVSLKYGLIIFIIFFAIYFFTKMIGFGDVLFSFIIGIFASNYLEAFIIFKNSFIYAAIYSLILILIRKKNLKEEIAFGPFMSFSVLVFLLMYR